MRKHMGSSPIDRTKQKPLFKQWFFICIFHCFLYRYSLFLFPLLMYNNTVKLVNLIQQGVCSLMFFIGIFGIDQKSKQIGTCNNKICPACGAMTRFEIYKSYSYFHIFFIPTFRWNTRYYVKSTCCGNMFELDPIIGEEFERGNNPEIKEEHLRFSKEYLLFKHCKNCGARSDPSYSYCPYCGEKL